MKKVVLIVILAQLFWASGVTSQSCLPDGITFTNQLDVDNFHNNFPNCTEIEGDVRFEGGLINLHGLLGLKSIGGFCNIFSTGLTDLTGLDSLTFIGGFLSVNTNHALLSLSGLEKLITIEGMLYVTFNYFLESLSSLNSLTSVGGKFSIGMNKNLSDFSGLENLTSIGGDIHIYGNDSLTSLSGLRNINANSIYNLMIYLNPSLSFCDVKSVCDYLANPNASISIHSNKTGCNSQEEVEELCDISSISELKTKSLFSFYPTPTKDKLNIQNKQNLTVDEVNIYNQIGQNIICQKGLTETIDVTYLKNGVYIIELTSNDLIFREKLIIKE